MKINLKISSREKILLIILLVTVILAVYFNFVYLKQIRHIRELATTYEENQSKIIAFENDKLLNEKIEKDIKIKNTKILEAVKEYFPSIIKEKILVVLDDMINKANIECSSITIAEVSDEVLQEKEKVSEEINLLEELVKKYKIIEDKKSNEDKNTDVNNNVASKNNTEAEEKSNLAVKNMAITLSVKGSYNEVIKFIDEIKGFYKRIVIKNIDLVAEEDKLTGNMVLHFYAVPKFAEENIDYNKWNIEGEYGKTNMFKDTSVKVVETNLPTDNVYDFSMSINPKDNTSIEEVKLYITEKDGKYYYKYSTTKESYPKDFNGDGVEFTPQGHIINFKIYFKERDSDNNLSKVNIKVYNNTSKTLDILVEDDKDTNRVNIIKEKGNINVSKN